jgi:hypothetical protein
MNPDKPPPAAIVFILLILLGILSVAVWGFIEVILTIGRAVN